MKNRLSLMSFSALFVFASIGVAIAQEPNTIPPVTNVPEAVQPVSNQDLPTNSVLGDTPEILRPSAPTPPPAASFRENPFIPTMTEAERAIADDEARMRRELQQMIPHIKRELTAEIREIVRTEMESGRPVTSVSMEGTVSGAEGVASGLALPLDAQGNPIAPVSIESGRPRKVEEATFTACINGKALYKDSSGVTFVNEKDDTTCPSM